MSEAIKRAALAICRVAGEPDGCAKFYEDSARAAIDAALNPAARDLMETAWRRVLYDATLDQEKADRIFELATINGLFDPYSFSPQTPGV